MNKIHEIRHLLGHYEQDIQSIQSRAEDLSGFQVIQPLISGFSYLPYTGWTVKPFFLATLLNDIVINNRKTVLELGSGSSTVFMARLAKVNRLDIKIYSLEHNKQWSGVIRNHLRRDDIEKYVEIIDAPLKDNPFDGTVIKWYDRENLYKAIEGIQFQLIVVDGPIVIKGNERYPAFPAVKNHFHDHFSFYVDDIFRKGEKDILQKWENLYNVKFERVNLNFARCVKGPFFDPTPHY